MITIIESGRMPIYQARCHYCGALLEFSSRDAQWKQYEKGFVLCCPGCNVTQLLTVNGDCRLVKEIEII